MEEDDSKKGRRQKRREKKDQELKEHEEAIMSSSPPTVSSPSSSPKTKSTKPKNKELDRRREKKREQNERLGLDSNDTKDSHDIKETINDYNRVDVSSDFKLNERNSASPPPPRSTAPSNRRQNSSSHHQSSRILSRSNSSQQQQQPIDIDSNNEAQSLHPLMGSDPIEITRIPLSSLQNDRPIITATRRRPTQEGNQNEPPAFVRRPLQPLDERNINMTPSQMVRQLMEGMSVGNGGRRSNEGWNEVRMNRGINEEGNFMVDDEDEDDEDYWGMDPFAQHIARHLGNHASILDHYFGGGGRDGFGGFGGGFDGFGGSGFRPYGFSPEELELLPISYLEEGDDKECFICTDKFEEQQLVSLPQCNHKYCEFCIKYWLRVNRTCPLCLTPVRIQKPSS